MCKFVVAHARQSLFSEDLAHSCLKFAASVRHQWWFSFDGLGPLLTLPPQAPCGTSAREHPREPAQPAPPPPDPEQVTGDTRTAKPPASLLPGQEEPKDDQTSRAGCISYLLLTLSQCYITTLFPTLFPFLLFFNILLSCLLPLVNILYLSFFPSLVTFSLPSFFILFFFLAFA